jgi:prevent-host-death family protein
MPAKSVSAADARARFGELLDGVLHRGERYVVERHGREVAAIVSVAELQRLDRAAPERPAGAMALVGLWHDVPDDEIDSLLEDLRASRDRDTGRSVEVEA